MAKVVFNEDKCKGCMLCVSACPKKIVSIQQDKMNKNGYFTAMCIDDDACIGCALCAVMCPDCAITVGGDKK